jgi:hypothetical protein
MKTTPIIAVLAAGSALSLSACKGKVEPTSNPPAPVVEETENPPAPIPAGNPPPPEQPEMPAWDDVASSHPEGATNPPIPFLYVTPEGDCYKDFVSPFRAGGPDGIGDRVREDCDTEPCGTQVVCPDRAQPLLDVYKARTADNTEDGTTGE